MQKWSECFWSVFFIWINLFFYACVVTWLRSSCSLGVNSCQQAAELGWTDVWCSDTPTVCMFSCQISDRSRFLFFCFFRVRPTSRARVIGRRQQTESRVGWKLSLAERAFNSLCLFDDCTDAAHAFGISRLMHSCLFPVCSVWLLFKVTREENKLYIFYSTLAFIFAFYEYKYAFAVK